MTHKTDIMLNTLHDTQDKYVLNILHDTQDRYYVKHTS